MIPAVHYGEVVFYKQAQVLHETSDDNEWYQIVSRVRKLMNFIVNCAMLYLWQSPNYPNPAVYLENQAIQRVVLVAQQRAMTLQLSTQYDRDVHDLMDNYQQNPPWIVCHAIWVLHPEILDDSYPMLSKTGGPLNHVQTDSFANER